MKTSARPERATGVEKLTPDQEVAVKAASTWVNQLARTLKNCRLYDANNSAAIRFRQELAVATQRLTEEHGTLVVRFSADDVFCEGVSLYPAKSRDDNLALPFFRDGVRTLTVSPGVEPRELDVLIDSLIRVTGQNDQDDDLVTLLWEAHLAHVNIDYVPGEADIGAAGDAIGVPWPESVPDETADPNETPSMDGEGAAAGAESGRSDDWAVGQLTTEIEANFDELESLSDSQVQRFKNEFEAEWQAPMVEVAIAVAWAFLGTGISQEEKLDLDRFLPRVLRQALDQGNWRGAREAARLLEACEGASTWHQTFVQELLQPISIAGVKNQLENQESAEVREFVAFALKLGDHAADLLAHVLTQIQNPRHQRQLGDAIVEACRQNPELLAPWLSDSRPPVVRSMVQILGAIGGSSIVGMLGSLADHADPGIRLEVTAALRNVDPSEARPLLVRLLKDADTRMFCAVLSQLSQHRDSSAAGLILGYLLESSFEQRPVEERRAVFMALSATGGDDVLPPLEAELLKGGWFSRGQDAHRQDVARCIARIGTETARSVLERGARSRRAAVRKACEGALMRFDKHE